MVNWSPNLQTAVSDLVCDVFLSNTLLFDYFFFLSKSDCLVLTRK